MRKIKIFDTTLRDGEQALGHSLRHGINSKVAIAQKLVEMNVDIIEAGFPISSNGDYEAVKKVAQEIHGPKIAALARVMKKDIDRAWDAIKNNPNPYLHTFSILINKEAVDVYGKGMDKIIFDSVEAVRYARQVAGKHDVQFSAQGSLYAISEALETKNEFALERIMYMHKSVIEAGANVINLPDTEGKLIPQEAAEAVKWFKECVPYADEISLHIHCHNDLGNAVANSIAGAIEGVDCVEVTVNGIGERSGNAALEEVVMNIYRISNKYNMMTGINTTMLNPVSDIVEYHTKEEKAAGKPIVGRKAFQHSSGIHQDGSDKGKNSGVIVYQAGFSADVVGWKGEESKLTAKSGKKGVKRMLERLGFDLTVEEVERNIMDMYNQCADTRDEVTDVDLRILVNRAYSKSNKIKYVSHSIDKSFHSDVYSGDVILEIDGNNVTSVLIDRKRNNVGGIDAVFNAVDNVVPFEVPRLVMYDPRNIGESHDTIAEVTIVLAGNGFDGNFHKDKPLYFGRATSKDTIEASVKAYIDAINDYCRRM
ncbi:MAG: alpha-isopropylmalate synthase regulatory domain-containing protein [Candidatus Woesearchaeota archaeon]